MEDIAKQTFKADGDDREPRNVSKAPTVASEIIVHPRTVASRTFIAALILLGINLLIVYLEKLAQLDTAVVRALVFFFDVGQEGNIPTLFSTLILALAALQLWLISRLATAHPQAGKARQWLILAWIFLFLSIDEATSIHEQFNKLRSFTPDNSGYLHYTWILPYAAFAAVVGLYYLGFLRRLPTRTRRLFIISGLVFVAAAIGFEPLQGRIVKIYEVGHLYDRLLSCAEEFLEMSSIVLFNYALADFLALFRTRIGFPSPARPLLP